MPVSLHGEKAPVVFRRGFRVRVRFNKRVPKSSHQKLKDDFKKDLKDKLKREIKNLIMSDDGETLTGDFDENSKVSMLFDSDQEVKHDVDTALHDVEYDMPDGETWSIDVQDIPDASVLYDINPAWYAQSFQERRVTWFNAFMRVFCCV